jgi:hypothetical protein
VDGRIATQDLLPDQSARLSKNTLKRIKSVLSGVFKKANQLGFFDGENPVKDSSVDPRAPKERTTHAYSREEVEQFLGILPEPACTIFDVAARGPASR